MMEKTLRVLGSDAEGGHSHSHSHGNDVSVATGVAVSGDTSGLKSRAAGKKDDDSHEEEKVETSRGPSKLSAYLNLFGDFVHNM